MAAAEVGTSEFVGEPASTGAGSVAHALTTADTDYSREMLVRSVEEDDRTSESGAYENRQIRERIKTMIITAAT